MTCDICHEHMSEDETGFYSLPLQVGGHIACMRPIVNKEREDATQKLEDTHG